MTKSALRITAAMALAIVATSPVIAAKLRLPPPRAPAQKIYSPVAIAGELQKRGYRIESMKRQGTAYSIRAVGPHKNKVQLMVDGRSGEIVGLAVIDPVADLVSLIAKAMTSGKNSRYIDDRYPFGIIVPEVYQTNWVVIPTWTVTAGAPRYIDAQWSGRGYRYAVPYATIRPGRGGRSRSTLAPARLQRPLYDVYDANGAELETVSYSEDTTVITEVTTEETTYSEEYSAMEESYLGGELDEEASVEISDFDAEDGDLSFADDTSDSYDAEVDEADFAAYADETDEANDTEVVDEAEAVEETEEAEAVEDSEEAEAIESEVSEDESEEPDEADDGGDDYEDSGDSDDDSDDGGEDYDDGGEEPEGGAR
jgi:hypothetical protein